MLVSGVQQNAPHKIYYKMITLTGPSYQLTAYTTVFNYYNFVVELTSESVMPPAYQVCSSFSRLFWLFDVFAGFNKIWGLFGLAFSKCHGYFRSGLNWICIERLQWTFSQYSFFQSVSMVCLSISLYLLQFLYQCLMSFLFDEIYSWVNFIRLMQLSMGMFLKIFFLVDIFLHFPSTTYNFFWLMYWGQQEKMVLEDRK